ncbi:unnamed protein product [Arabis nemorensis]|uniref:Glutamine amidotransferase domain-containing protein n=1 Tax=Arabis nemorensis TaxID=586526 RepID=A0A565AV01_9BRAS|nr:unnamed protein product [Arabis nemorensis]
MEESNSIFFHVFEIGRIPEHYAGSSKSQCKVTTLRFSGLAAKTLLMHPRYVLDPLDFERVSHFRHIKKKLIIARVRGGTVGRARKGPELRLGDITIVKEAIKPGSYFGDEIPSSMAIIKCHQDEVLVLPETAKLLAYSERYEVEMFSIEDHFLCIQGHPEYNKEILFEIVDRVLGYIKVCYISISLLLY